MQRHAAFAIPFHARDFSAAQTAGAIDPNAKRAKPHRGLHRALHGTTESHATFQLLRDAFSNQHGIDFRLADFDDVERHFGTRHLLQILAQHFDIRALLADDNTGAGSMNGHARLLRRAFNHHAAHAGALQAITQLFTQLEIFMQHLGIIRGSEPAAIPSAMNAKPKPDGIDFLAHTTRPPELQRLPPQPVRPPQSSNG